MVQPWDVTHHTVTCDARCCANRLFRSYVGLIEIGGRKYTVAVSARADTASGRRFECDNELAKLLRGYEHELRARLVV